MRLNYTEGTGCMQVIPLYSAASLAYMPDKTVLPAQDLLV